MRPGGRHASGASTIEGIAAELGSGRAALRRDRPVRGVPAAQPGIDWARRDGRAAGAGHVDDELALGPAARFVARRRGDCRRVRPRQTVRGGEGHARPRGSPRPSILGADAEPADAGAAWPRAARRRFRARAARERAAEALSLVSSDRAPALERAIDAAVYGLFDLSEPEVVEAERGFWGPR